MGTEQRQPTSAASQRSIDPTGTGGDPFLLAASWWALAAGIMLLLPRQWASAGISLVLSLVLRMWHRRRVASGKHAPSGDG